jgi:hypothetical protein
VASCHPRPFRRSTNLESENTNIGFSESGFNNRGGSSPVAPRSGSRSQAVIGSVPDDISSYIAAANLAPAGLMEKAGGIVFDPQKLPDFQSAETYN